MLCDTSYKLSSPLFMYALIIVNAIRQADTHVSECEPPPVQSIAGYMVYNCNASGRSGRKKYASAAVRLTYRLFTLACVVPPAGVCEQTDVPKRLDKMPAWLGWLSEIEPKRAVAMLSDWAEQVPASVYTQVEDEYNAGVTLSKRAELALLEPGTLKHLVSTLNPASSVSTHPSPLAVPSTLTGASQGTFYYIGAGVGCGITEIQEVGYCCTCSCLTRDTPPSMHDKSSGAFAGGLRLLWRV
jgi:hypothetical protein